MVDALGTLCRETMYPLVTPSLTLSDLAKHWTRHFPERPPQQEVFDYLLQAVWSNELLPQRKDGSSVSVAELLRMVQQAGSTSGHPRIFVYDDPARPPAELETLPDGNVKIYVGKSVYLPTDESRWTPDVVSEACAILASCGLADFNRLIWPGFTTLRVTREAFEAFCIGREHELPGFWFNRGSGSRNRPKSFGGRPSVMRGIEAEMRRRSAAGALAPTLREEAKYLHRWARKTIPVDRQVPRVAAIENALRDLYRQLKKLQLDRPLNIKLVFRF